MRADGGCHVAGGLDAEAALFCDAEQRFCGLFREERQVDTFPSEGPLVGAGSAGAMPQ